MAKILSVVAAFGNAMERVNVVCINIIMTKYVTEMHVIEMDTIACQHANLSDHINYIIIIQRLFFMKPYKSYFLNL